MHTASLWWKSLTQKQREDFAYKFDYDDSDRLTNDDIVEIYNYHFNHTLNKTFRFDEVVRLLQSYRFDLSSGITPNIGDTSKDWLINKLNDENRKL